jgi:hypothetical protein
MEEIPTTHLAGAVELLNAPEADSDRLSAGIPEVPTRLMNREHPKGWTPAPRTSGNPPRRKPTDAEGYEKLQSDSRARKLSKIVGYHLRHLIGYQPNVGSDLDVRPG